MLILSRRQNDKVIFPNLNIAITVTKLEGRVVRLGIEAPNRVKILRGELADQTEMTVSKTEAEPRGSHSSERKIHAIRNQLNKAMLSLQIAEVAIETGDAEQLESLIHETFKSLQAVDDQLFEDVPHDTDAASELPASLPAKSEAHSTRHAVIVDDDQNEAGLLAQLLELKGFSTHICENGQQAYAWLTTHERPDILLMDMHMPVMDGATTMQHIRDDQRLSSLPVFGVSGMEEASGIAACGGAAVDCWFTKPVNASQLVEKIQWYCERENISA